MSTAATPVEKSRGRRRLWVVGGPLALIIGVGQCGAEEEPAAPTAQTVNSPAVTQTSTAPPASTAPSTLTPTPTAPRTHTVTPTPTAEPPSTGASKPTPTPTGIPKPPPPPPELSTPPGVPETAQPATVVSITDGDTLDLRATEAGALPVAAAVSVRLLEIDTPETVHPSEPVGCFGPAASTALTRLAPPGSTVWVLPDVELRDQYDRYLMYLWSVSDGKTRFINRALVRGGFAQAALYEPNDRYIDLMRQAEAKARAADTGLWGACAYFGQPLNPDPLPPLKEERPSPSPPPGAGCDRASYPDVCIPAYPPDLDCGEIDATDFTVRPPDLHGFDSEPDGIGCES